MGMFSIWHLLVLLMLLAGAAGILGLIIWLAIRSGREADEVAGPHATVPRRLQQLEDLRVQGLVSEAEYQERRALILQDI